MNKVRLEALNQRLTRYSTGEPCKHGHVGERFVSTGACVKCVYRSSGRRPGRPVDLAVQARNKARKAEREARQDRLREERERRSLDKEFHQAIYLATKMEAIAAKIAKLNNQSKFRAPVGRPKNYQESPETIAAIRRIP